MSVFVPPPQASAFPSGIPTPARSEEIKIHLAEYASLRSEIELYANRIDQTFTLYSGAALALLAFCLRPASGVDAAYLTRVFNQWGGSAILLLVSWLNSVLLVRMAFLAITVFTMARHINTVLAPRLSVLVNCTVLTWDSKDSLLGMKSVSFLRGLSQATGIVLAEGFSIFIEVHSWHAANDWKLLTLWGVAALLGVTTVFCFALIIISHQKLR